MFTATYSPDDNKLRLYASSRLDADTFARVKTAGFKWAPQQQLFVAPMWTPDRADLLMELAGEIGDDDTSLTDRAEARADRFDDYREHRAADAESAREAVAAIADGIPFGQPILVGHHSERHARRDAERIENGMRRAVKMWETSKYWQARAAGAIRHAKYKERPDVRARRIKGLESDRRKQEKHAAESKLRIMLWGSVFSGPMPRQFTGEDTPDNRALWIANYFSTGYGTWSELRDGKITPRAAMLRELTNNARYYAWAKRWTAHIDLRLTYERAMMAEAGGTIAERIGPEQGGAVRCWASPGYGRGWSYVQKVNKVSVSVLDNWGNGGGNFKRTIALDKLTAVMTRAAVEAARADGRLVEAADGTGFYLTDTPPPTPPREDDRAPAAGDFDAMRATLKAGVRVVSAPQLFPTPDDLARQVIDRADVRPGQRVLEPSAGTGNLIRAIVQRFTGADCGRIVAVEVNPQLGEVLEQYRRKLVYTTAETLDIRCGDFLACNGDLGTFDRIVMNPPFADGQDIAHVRHAYEFLKPGGRLVAIMSEGPFFRSDRKATEFRAWLEERNGTAERLPADAFKNAGTGVQTRLVVIDRQV